MNSYETMYILRPDLLDEQVNQTIEKYQSMLRDQGAQDLSVQLRGKHRLAYEINRQRDGIYVQMNYQANGSVVAPMERAMRLSEEVIRYLTIRLEDVSPKAAASAEAEAETADATA
ncbi:30S ribosomal protein S6 [Aerosakkonemataceae cyanobacterium BLCC-F154]|uniref:Small ribosomal subunit protein bS6 n=1 Tax=Floridaenema fluviatile BLCC-F154 TaxID=3153640 RepID=A0ABV4YIF3_9CYAN